MRYLILRRKARIALLILLLLATVASIVPWVYSNFFLNSEDLVRPGASWSWQGYNIPSVFREDEIRGPISMDIDFLNNGYVFYELHAEGLELKGSVISGDVFIKGRFSKDDKGNVNAFFGKLFSRNISLNSNLFMPVSASFNIKDDVLEIESLSFGKKAYGLRGNIGLKAPFEADLRLDIKRADIKDLALIVKSRQPAIALGMMNGVFYIKGNFSSLYSNGILESRNGKIGRVEYDVATVRIEGFGPIINIVDSKARWGKSLLFIEGFIDLRNIEKGNLFEGLRVKSDMKTIVWDGWDIDQKGKDELSMSKDISDRMRVGFKAFAKEPLTPYRDRESVDEMSLEYKMGVEHLKMRLKENEEFFGIEHSVKF